MPNLINFEIIKNPLNWAIVTTMVLLSAAGAALVTTYLETKKGN
jgi:hypothetical protein